MLAGFAMLMCGFSLGAALLVPFARNVGWPWGTAKLPGIIAGAVLLTSLAGLQLAHWQLLWHADGLFYSRAYLWLLYTVAPAFYFYARPLLTLADDYRPSQLAHALPLFAAALLPWRWAVPVAFLFGSGYALWLAAAVYRLRAERRRFRMELLFLATLAALGLGVVALGWFSPLLATPVFVALYASMLGLLFFGLLATLLRFPSLPVAVGEAVQATYAESTLKRVDCPAKLAELAALMDERRVYEQEDLNLPMLAEMLQLNQHQLSELVNVHLGRGFSRYLREYRIAAAKRLLQQEPTASVLSVGMSVGFVSQSAFYAAFKEIEGVAPGQYRKTLGDGQN